MWTYRALEISCQHITLFSQFPVTTARASACLPRHLFLELSQRELRNMSCFRLRAQTQGYNSTWNSGTSLLCDRCDCAQVQDEVHALLMCRDVGRDVGGGLLS